MTTKHSPLSAALKAQADKIAAMLKGAERGEPQRASGTVPFDVAAARAKPSITFAVVMDDKTLKIEMEWDTIAGVSEVALAEYILKHMRESRETMQ